MNLFKEKEKPLIILAPLHNFSDTGLRVISKKFGVDITYTGMISCYNLIKNNGLDFKILDEERPIAIQIFGDDEDRISQAVKILNDFADIIDLNFSCPSNRILENRSGGYLLKDIDKVKKIIEKAISVSKIPVSVKIRKGFSKNDESYIKIGKICEELGVFYLTIHPRSVLGKFKEEIDLSAVFNLKNNLKIPVIHSGDVKDHLIAKEIYNRLKCDGIMIGRGAIGNPWIFSSIKDYIFKNKIPMRINLSEKIEVLIEHIVILNSLYSEYYTLKQMKLHIPRYLKGYPGINKLNKILNGVKSIKELLTLIKNFKYF